MPAPALVMPPEPAMTLEFVRVTPLRTWKMESVAPDVTTPPLIVAFDLASTPPLLKVRVFNALIVKPPPVSIVRELNVF